MELPNARRNFWIIAEAGLSNGARTQRLLYCCHLPKVYVRRNWRGKCYCVGLKQAAASWFRTKGVGKRLSICRPTSRSAGSVRTCVGTVALLVGHSRTLIVPFGPV